MSNPASAVSDHLSAPDHAHDAHHPHDFAHPLPLWILFAVFAALTVLTIITVAQANYDLGSLDVIVVMSIATVKAILVMLFFMHLAFDKPFNLIIFISSFVFVGLFIMFTLTDAQMNSPTFEPVVDEVTTTATMASAPAVTP